MRLLVSVRNAEEAESALQGGADILDAKEPANGALGKVDATTLAASSAPSDAEAYVVADLASLPVRHLPIQVVVAPPLDVNTLATLVV